MHEPTLPPERCEAGEVVLRKYAEGDGPDFYALVSRNADRLAPFFPGVMQQVTGPETASLYVAEKRHEWERRQAFFFAVCDAASGAQIGQVRFKTVDWSSGRSEIAYFIDRSCEGRRHMSSAVRALIAIGFGELGLEKVYARVTPYNHRSRHLLERCGFKEEGLIRQDFRTLAGELADVLCFGLRRESWG